MLLKSFYLTALTLGSALPALAQQPAPDLDWGKQKHYAAANQRLGPPTASRPRVVLLGNSITQGWPQADSAFFKTGPYELVGRGIGGQTTPQMLLRFRNDVLNLHPRVVVILAGINDIAQNTGPYDPVATLGHIESMTQLAQANGVRVVLSSVLPAADFKWRPGLAPAPKVVALNQQLKALAARYRCPYIDYHSAMADASQGLPPNLATDGVHPTLAGYRIMEPLLLQGIAEALKKKQ